MRGHGWILFTLFFFSSAFARDTLVDELRGLSGIQAGLVLLTDVDDAQNIIRFAADGRYLVHGLAQKQAIAQKVREELAGKGLSGIAHVECLAPGRLPYNDRTVNLIISSDLPGLLKSGVTVAEIERVLTPQGALCVVFKAEQRPALEAAAKTLKISTHRFAKKSMNWLIIKKKRNPGLDDWGHYQHAADGNPVSRDQVIEAPNLLQWIVGPTRNHGRLNCGPAAASPGGVVSAGGRNYYLQGGNIIARNSFNGVMLWVKPLRVSMWQMVAVDDELYLCHGGKLMALDGNSGELKRMYSEGLRCSKIFVDGDTLFGIANELIAFDRTSGEKKWASPIKAGLASKGRLYGSPKRGETVCLSQKDGKQLWRRETAADTGGKAGLRFVTKGIVVFSEGSRITVLHGDDGRKLWSANSNKKKPLIFEAADLLWLEHDSKESTPGQPPIKNKGAEIISRWEGHDLISGKVVKKTTGPTNVTYRCHTLYATDRFMIGNRPVYFTDWKSGESYAFEGTRAQCGTAYSLAQGLFLGLYTTPDKCMCISTAIAGITAYAADGKTPNGEMPVNEKGRLIKGEATPPAADEVLPSGDDWPMYRYDRSRSGNAGTALPASLKTAWKVRLEDQDDRKALLRQDWLVNRPCGDRITAPTAAAGKVFTALRHSGVVVALDAKTGNVLWRRTLPARVNAPPTYYKGVCMTGCNDGRVYCHRADNGKSIWSLRVAPDERRMMAYGQLESAWPVVGGVLLVKDTAYAVAGRQAEIDGGLYVNAFDPLTGEVAWTQRICKKDQKPFGGWTPRRSTDFVGTSDVLCSNGKVISMSGTRRGKMFCDSGQFVNNWDFGVKFSWNPTRYRRDQFGIERIPVAFFNSGYVTMARGNKIKRYGKNGWEAGIPASKKVEALAALSGSAAARKSPKRPVVRVPKVEQAPALDGKIDPVYEKQGTPLRFRFLNGNRKQPKEATTAWVLSDTDNLYFAIRCEKKNPDQLVTKKTKRDGGVWEDEVIEIFLDPVNYRGPRYYHFIVNSAGVVQDAYKGDTKWNGDLQVTCGKEAGKAWVAEVRIPLKTLGVKPGEARHLWSMNLNRSARKFSNPSDCEDTAWAPTGTNSSHVPDMFGYLWLDAGKGGDNDAAYTAFYAKTAPKAEEAARPGKQEPSGQPAQTLKEMVLKHQAARATQVASSPKIDGVIDPLYEKKGTSLSFSFLDGNQDTPGEATKAWTLCDQENLYVAFRCFKKDLSKLLCTKTKRDDNVWQDEVVELFLDPLNKRDMKYFHIIINSAGAVQDSKNKSDASWNPALEIKCGKEEKAWTVEVRIPFKELGIKGKPDRIWSVNFNRSARDPAYPSAAEDTSWAPTGTTSSHAPDKFGYLWVDAGKDGRDNAAYTAWFDGLPRVEKKKPTKGDAGGDVVLAAIANSKASILAGGELRVFSATNGAKVGEAKLPAAPSWDGIAAAGGRIFVTLQDTTVICLGAPE